MKLLNFVKTIYRTFFPDKKEEIIDTYKEKAISSGIVFTGKRKGTILNFKYNDNLGSGVIYRNKKFVTHTNLDDANLALITVVPWQRKLFGIFLILLLLGIVVNFKLLLIFLVTLITLIYFADLVFSVFILYRSLKYQSEIKISKDEIAGISEADLPVYTVLCPLYKESEVLGQFINSIEALDWPKNKLEALLLLEEDDIKTINAVSEANLPDYFKVLIVPDSKPKTKPKACNYGLAHSEGKYVVIYDAEDRPDPLQLKKAYIAFNKLGINVACLQCKLNYYNQDQNFLTRLFTAEYSLWFDMVLPGLQSINTVIPLGGTSNHFKVSALKVLGGWDPFNVTEDCDLGIRLFKSGFKTAIVDSETLEEANSRVGSWIKQRSRWIKGYLQTYLVHTRDPIKLSRKLKFHALLFQLVIGMRMVFIALNPLMWLMTISYFVFNKYIGLFIESLYILPIFYLGAICLVFGNFMYFYIYMIGLANKEKWNLIKYIYAIPFYWIITSIAALKAVKQLFNNPYFWEKTEHGLHLQEKGKRRAISDLFKIPNINFAPDNFSTYFPIIAIVVGLTIIFLEFKNRNQPDVSNLGLFSGLGILDFKRINRNKRIAGYLRAYRKLLSVFSDIFFVIQKNIIDLFYIFNVPQNPKKDSEKLNILIFNWRDTKHKWAGGAEIYIHEIAKRWVKKGHYVTQFCGYDGNSKPNEVVGGINIIRRGGFYTVYPLAMLYYLVHFRNKYDIIIDCENGIPFFTPLFSTMPRVLLVHHVHQEVFRSDLKFPLARIALFLESELMPIVYRNTKIVTVSASSKKGMIKMGLSGKGEIEIVNPGIDFRKYYPTKKSVNPSILYLGRLKSYKSIDTLIKSMPYVLQTNAKSSLVIAGFGENRKKLERLVKKYNLESKIRFAGKVSDRVKVRLMGRSWVFAYPSTMEGWGISVIEANACGTPVVASNVPGLRDSVINSKTGYLVKVKDEKSFANKISRLISNTKLRKQLERESVIWAKRFEWDKSAYKFLNIIQDLNEDTNMSILKKIAVAKISEG